eukprot:COSAG02_NODE_4412_length_5386_cov_8.158880_5_plen_87_part_01
MAVAADGAPGRSTQRDAVLLAIDRRDRTHAYRGRSFCACVSVSNVPRAHADTGGLQEEEAREFSLSKHSGAFRSGSIFQCFPGAMST